MEKHLKSVSCALILTSIISLVSACKTLDNKQVNHPEKASPQLDSVKTEPASQPVEQSGTLISVQDNASKEENEKEVLSTHIDTTLWPRLREGFALQHTINDVGRPKLNHEINWFLKQPGYIDTVSLRSEKYLHYILDEVEKRNMPTEVVLLPFVESGFDPFAYSYVSASGLWQFMPRTGASFGLKQDWWKDDRRDIVKSTQAALTYLEQLNKRFDGDWLLALAAYNSGAGNVSKAIRKNKRLGKPINFWHLDLPKQTQHYVPRLLALATMYNNPEKYKLNLADIENKAFFKQVHVGSQIDLSHAADLAGVPIREITLLNPSFNRFATHPEGPHTILVPIKNADEFEKNLLEVPKHERVNWTRYTIKPGDSLSVIAARYNMNTQTIKSINQLQSNAIRAGKTLLIPVSSDAKRLKLANNQYSKLTQKAYEPKQKSIKKTYTVNAGDSLWSIARQHDVTVNKLLRWNSLSKRDVLKPGQQITLWFTYEKSAASNNNALQKIFYKVRKGDSLHRIADKFNLKVQDVVKWNNVGKKKYLQPGDKLTLFVDVTNVY